MLKFNVLSFNDKGNSIKHRCIQGFNELHYYLKLLFLTLLKPQFPSEKTKIS